MEKHMLPTSQRQRASVTVVELVVLLVVNVIDDVACTKFTTHQGSETGFPHGTDCPQY